MKANLTRGNSITDNHKPDGLSLFYVDVCPSVDQKSRIVFIAKTDDGSWDRLQELEKKYNTKVVRGPYFYANI